MMVCTVMFAAAIAGVCLLLPASVTADLDSQGTEFILGFLENRQYMGRAEDHVQVMITTSSPTPAEVTLTLPALDSAWERKVTVTSDSSQKVTMPVAIRGRGVEKSNKGVRIQASQPVSVLAVNKEKFSTDVFLALPVDVLGTEYYAITYQRDPELMVVATQEHTQVSVQWPSGGGRLKIKYDGAFYRNGDVTSVTLNQFETFHVLYRRPFADFTGAYITANKPIAVISGNRKVVVPVEGRSADHLAEMLTPVSTWGKEFVTTSTPDRGRGDLFRCVASQDNTSVQISGVTSFLLATAGDYQTVNIPSEESRRIVADKAIQVAMFSKSLQDEHPDKGDPAMSLVPPAAQYLSQYSWSSVQDHQDKELDNMVSVVIHKDDAQGLRLDDQPVVWDGQKDVEGSSTVTLWAHVTPGVHHLVHSDPSVTFMALASGSSRYNSYAVPVGMGMRKINVPCTPTTSVPGDGVDNDCDGRVDEEIDNSIDDDGDGSDDEDLEAPRPVDGNWGEWIWGECTVTCGSGTVEKVRKCDSPAPQHGGQPCPGNATTVYGCVHERCRAVNGNWGEWTDESQCSVTCGEGEQTRSRQCDNPAPEHGGAPCDGASSEQHACTLPPCPVDGNWGVWQSSGCSVTCGSGTYDIFRHCDSPAPAHGGQPCPGIDRAQYACGLRACISVNGNWGEWTDEGQCSVTCGEGEQTRSRQCDNPAPEHGGAPCDGASSEQQACTMPPCPE